MHLKSDSLNLQNLPLDTLSTQIAQAAKSVPHTTKATRHGELHKKPKELKDAQTAIFASMRGEPRQAARRTYTQLKER